MSNQHLLSIVEKLRVEDSRWDAILELKLLSDPDLVDPLLELATDSDWVIRWCVAEKLGDLNNTKAIPRLLTLLGDSDYHVIKNAAKALQKFGTQVTPDLVPLYAHPHVKVREAVFGIFKHLGPKAFPQLITAVNESSWVVSNRLVHTLFTVGKQEAEDYLLEALSVKHVQKNTIIMLGMLKSKASIPHTVKLYDNPGLKRVILYSFKLIGKDKAFPVLVGLLQNKILKMNAGKLCLKIGPAVLPYLVKSLRDPASNKKLIIKLMEKIGPQRVMDSIHHLSKQDPEVKALTRDLRLKYPYKKASSTDSDEGFWGSLFR